MECSIFLGVLFICLQRLTVADDIEVIILGNNGYTGLVQISVTQSSSAVPPPDTNRNFQIRRDTYETDLPPTLFAYVCDDEDWGINTAEVICRHLGHIDVREVLRDAENIFGEIEPHSDTLFVHGLSCESSKTSLSDCTYNSMNTTRCSELAGVTCRVKSDSSPKHQGLLFFLRMFTSLVMIPLFAVACVACRCCHRYCDRKRRRYPGSSRRRRNNTRTNTQTSNREAEANWQATMAAADSEDLPSYDEIMRDTSSSMTCTVSRHFSGARDSGCYEEEEGEEDEPEEPPPSYDSLLIGVILEDQTQRPNQVI